MAVLNTGIVVLYLLIGRRWWQAAKASSRDGRFVWVYLLLIFIVCAHAGYGVDVLKIWFPRTGVILRLTLLSVDWILCINFLRRASSYTFELRGRNERIGDELTRAMTRAGGIDDMELLILTRRLVVMSRELETAVTK